MPPRDLKTFAALAIAAFMAAAGDGASPYSPHVISNKGAAPIAGRIVSDDSAAEIVINTFNSRNVTMTLGVEKIAKTKSLKIDKNKNPLLECVELARKERKLGVEVRVERAKILKDAGLKELAKEECVLAAVLAASFEPGGNAELAKIVGEAEWNKLQKSDPRLNATLRSKLDRYFTIEKFADRKKLHEQLAKEFNYTKSFLYLERAARSREQKKGRHDNRAVTMRSKDVKGVYTIFVPSKYDSLTITPLVVALHGGGAGGKDGSAVVGSGPDAMNFYQSQAERHGFIVVCPTAAAAPWPSQANDPLLMAILEEVSLLYNIDENRIYLTGHSMGGFGTWYFGPKYAHLWAAIAPMSGGGSRDLPRLKEMGMGIYLYHGADDDVVKVNDSRRAGEAMRKDGMDFVYTELPKSGHGCPPEIIEECFDFFEAHRLHATPDRSAKGKFEITKTALSSFDRKVNDAEIEYFGDPSKPEAKDTVATCIVDIKKGGGAAEAALKVLIELNDPAAAKPLNTIAANPKETKDARWIAIRGLEHFKNADSVSVLIKILKEEEPNLTIAAADALGAMGDAKAVAPLREALKFCERFLKSKITGPSRIDYVDYDKACNLAGSVVRALGALGGAPAAAEIVKFPGEGLIYASYQIDAEPRAGQNPEKPRKKLAAIVKKTLEQLNQSVTLPFLEKLKSLS
ncbi:MAG: HEAT repeat domain-containing protein [Planctomycetota bacterium]